MVRVLCVPPKILNFGKLFNTNKTALTFETRARRRDVCVPVCLYRYQTKTRAATQKLPRLVCSIEMQYQNYVRNDLPK